MKTQEGQKVLAYVEEILSNQHLIVSLDGALFRVINNTGKIFSLGDKIQLVVTRKEPLELQLLENHLKTFERFA